MKKFWNKKMSEMTAGDMIKWIAMLYGFVGILWIFAGPILKLVGLISDFIDDAENRIKKTAAMFMDWAIILREKDEELD